MAFEGAISEPPSESVQRRSMLIGGQWVEAKSGKRFKTLNPYTGITWASVPEAGQEDVDAAVRAATDALEGPWGAMTASARGKLISKLGEIADANADDLALAESTDNGKLLREMASQMRSLPDWFDYFGGLADKVEGSTPPPTKPGMFVYTRHEPIGVVAAIVPWNSPLLLLTFKLAPALAAGCTIVVKPSEHTPVSALAFGELIEQAGIPPGVFNVVTGAGDTGRMLSGHPGVRKVAFTGSTRSGISVMKSAADHLAKVTLELGGKSPTIVFDDADLDVAANGVMAGIFAATGQTCIAGSRLLVAGSVHEELVDRIASRARTIRMGNPLAPDTEMGPVATKEQLDKIESYVDAGTSAGAQLMCGGRKSDSDELRDGYFFEPTILDGVDNQMQVAREEIFGPVLSVIPFEDESDAIRIANDTEYGLGAGVWTNNLSRAHRVAHSVRAGTVWVNCYRVIMYNVPFGGYQHSGMGRENGVDAVREYTETKSVVIDMSGEVADPFVMGGLRG